MNERIKELWDKAAQAAAAYPSGQNNSWETQVNFMEKFAELIVKECAKFLDENSGYDGANNAWHPEPEDLLEHFGVEE